MVTADARTVFAQLVQARSSSMLRTAYLLTGDRAAAERLLERALRSVHQHHVRIDPFEAESQVRATMVRTAVGRSRTARLRVVLALSRHEGLPDAEIAHLLDCSVATVTRDRLRAEPMRLQVPDNLGASDHWRADVSSELADLPPPPPAGRRALVLVAAVALVVAVLATVLDDPAPEPPRPPASGNESDLQWMRSGEEPRVDLLDSQGMLHIAGGGLVPVGTFSRVVGRTPAGWVVGSDRGFELVRRDGSRRPFAGADGGSGALSPGGGRLVTRNGIFDTATGLRIRGPWPQLDRGTGLVGWGASGAVAVTSDGTGYLLREYSDPVQLERPPYAVASGSDRVLVRGSKGCDQVAELDESGRLRPIRSWCDGRSLSLSPDGRTVMIGRSHDGTPVGHNSRPEGLLDVETGGFMMLPELHRLDEYGGNDLVAVTWEDAESVLLAYLVDEPRVRLIRCVSGEFACETASATRLPPRSAPHLMFPATTGS